MGCKKAIAKADVRNISQGWYQVEFAPWLREISLENRFEEPVSIRTFDTLKPVFYPVNSGAGPVSGKSLTRKDQ